MRIREIEKVELGSETLFECAKKRLLEIEQLLQEMESALKEAPEGKLRIVRNGNTQQYFLRGSPSDRKGIYLTRSQDPLAIALAQKDYDHKLMLELRLEAHAIRTFLDNYHPERVDEIFRSLHDKRKPLVTPIRLLDVDYVNQWTSVAYEKKEFAEDAPEFYTARGERVRSKSEILIADALNRHGIPYRYEFPIYIAGIGIVYPDFTCLNVRTRKVILLEHFGMMSDSAYADITVNKLEKYLSAGYYPGINIILSFETAARPLSSRVIEQNIRGYLLLGFCPFYRESCHTRKPEIWLFRT